MSAGLELYNLKLFSIIIYMCCWSFRVERFGSDPKSSFYYRGRGAERWRARVRKRAASPAPVWDLTADWLRAESCHQSMIASCSRTQQCCARSWESRLKMTRERGAASKAKLTHPGKAILAGQLHIISS